MRTGGAVVLGEGEEQMRKEYALRWGMVEQAMREHAVAVLLRHPILGDVFLEIFEDGGFAPGVFFFGGPDVGEEDDLLEAWREKLSPIGASCSLGRMLLMNKVLGSGG